jgi:hypothetical protein
MTQPISRFRFRHPFDVARDATLDPEARRAILASWLSDGAAVKNQPALRKPAGASEPILVDDIFMALRMLDDGQNNSVTLR